MAVSPLRIRAAEEIGPGKKLGEYSLASPPTLGVGMTTIAAATATAGHVFAFRNAHATTKVYVRYVGIHYVVTTGFTNGQEVGFDMVVARTWSASHTGGTAIDMGGTVTTANQLRVGWPTSCMATGDCRMGTTGALTAGTQTLDPNPVGIISGYPITTTAGVYISRTQAGNLPVGTLFDARDDQSPLVLGTNEGFIIRNVVLQGAAGVANFRVFAQWEEGTA